MRENYKVYKLLEVIEMPIGTDVHMINGNDYKIDKNGELVSKDGESLPISKRNIDNCEFTIIEELKNYNFRVYKNDELIVCFNKIIEKSNAQMLGKDLYDSYKDKCETDLRSICCNQDVVYYSPRYVITVEVEEIMESC